MAEFTKDNVIKEIKQTVFTCIIDHEYGVGFWATSFGTAIQEGFSKSLNDLIERVKDLNNE